MPNEKITVCFVLPDLSRGGAQRIMTYVAANLDKSQFKCTLLVVNSPKDTDFKVEGIEVKFLNKSRLLNATLPLFKILNSRCFDIVIGSIGHINKVLGMYSYIIKNTKFIGREASLDTIISKYNKDKEPLITRYLDDYRKRFDALICQSNDMAEDSIKAYNLDRKKVVTINNPLTIEPPQNLVNKPTNEVKQLITIGRLSEEKGHKRILDTLSKLKLNWHYTIIGFGIEEENIINQIKDLNIENKVTLKSHVDNVNEILPNYDLFLQGSYVEGFPNATVESCLFGTPVVAFNAPGGTKEIITNGVNGYIAKNEDEYAEFIIEALTKQNWDRQSVSNSVTKKFNSDLILSKYKDLFISLTNR